MTAGQLLRIYTKKQTGKLILLIFSTCMFALLGLVTPLIFSFFIDQVINLEPMSNSLEAAFASMLGGVDYLRSNIWVGAAAVLVVNLVMCLFVFLRGYLNGVVSENIVHDLRNDLYRHLQRLPYRYHANVKTGELIQKCTSDVDVIRRAFAQQFAQMIYAISLAVMALIIMFNIYAPLAWIAIISVPFLFIYALNFFQKTQAAFEKSDQAEGLLTADVQENLSGIRVVKAFNKERYEIDRFTVRNREFRDLTAEVIRLLGRYWGSSDLLCMLQILAVLVCGIFMVRNGSITLGSFFVFLTYESNMIYPIRNLGRILADMGKMMVSAGRIAAVMSEQEEDVESGITPKVSGDIVFDHVGFHYDDDPKPVLNDVSFSLKKGQVLAIIGPTGSGKSSLVHLLSRLYDCTSGTIYIDGHDIKTIQKDYLRHQIGIVLQEPYLYSRSIYDNISIGQDDTRMDRVRSAARIASVDEVIESFGQGYSTLVGEKGVTLSGGQKQRIAIAGALAMHTRTIMNDTPILIFDDSLSAVDTETDAAIRHAIHTLQKDVSMIIITQRIDSAREADEIIVLENGTITEQGTHDELASKDGLYRRIDEIQSNLDLEGGDPA